MPDNIAPIAQTPESIKDLPTVNPTPVVKKSGSSSLIIIVLLLLVIVAGGVGAFVLIKNQNDQNVKKDDQIEESKDEKKAIVEEGDSAKDVLTDLQKRMAGSSDEEVDFSDFGDISDYYDQVFKTVKLPNDLPSDAPIYDEKAVYSVEEDNDSFNIMMRHGSDDASIDETYEFYLESLENEGWSIIFDSKTSISFSITGEKDNGERNIYVTASDVLGLYIDVDVTK